VIEHGISAVMEKTLKLRTYSDATQDEASQGKPAKERNIALELEKRTAHLEEERSKSLDLMKTIVQLRESLKQEQTKTALLESRVIKLDSVEENQLVKKNAQLEEEKKKSLEYMKTIEQLRENLKRDQEQLAEVLHKKAELESRVNKMDSVEENQLIKKNTLLEEEKKKSLEYAKLIDQLRENVKEDQEKTAAMAKRTAELEAKINELSGVLGKISSLAAAGKLESDN
jgi:chromosome segregation ATPase